MARCRFPFLTEQQCQNFLIGIVLCRLLHDKLKPANACLSFRFLHTMPFKSFKSCSCMGAFHDFRSSTCCSTNDAFAFHSQQLQKYSRRKQVPLEGKRTILGHTSKRHAQTFINSGNRRRQSIRDTNCIPGCSGRVPGKGTKRSITWAARPLPLLQTLSFVGNNLPEPVLDEDLQIMRRGWTCPI